MLGPWYDKWRRLRLASPSVASLIVMHRGRSFSGGMTMKLPNCDVCDEPCNSNAIIWCMLRDVDEREARLSEWRARRTGPMIDWNDLPPRLVRWNWGHRDCAPEGGDYWFEGKRFNTMGKAMSWTLHLMDKSWFEHTDWEPLVRRLHIVPDA